MCLLYFSTSMTIQNTCLEEYHHFHIDKIIGTKIGKTKLSNLIGFPTLTLRLDNEIPCGFYRGTSKFGDITAIVGKNDKSKADITLLKYRSGIEKTERIELENLDRIIANDSDFIATFNSGCCY